MVGIFFFLPPCFSCFIPGFRLQPREALLVPIMGNQAFFLTFSCGVNMEIIPTRFPGLWVIQPKVFEDHRGFFVETYNQRDFISHGIYYDFVQDNHARSEQVGVLRGLHFQTPPAAQAKLVRVTRGSVYDVVVDIRKGSPTYGQWYGEELSGKNFRQMLIPKGFAHGYVTLEPKTEFQYKVDGFYAPEHDGGLRWDDPDIGIPWPVDEPILSDKDKRLPLMKDFDSPFVYTPS